MEEITLTYTEDLLKRAVRSFWWGVVGSGFIAVLFLLLVINSFFVVNGERSWAVGVLSSVIGMGVIFPVVLYVSHYRNILGKFRRLGGSSSILRLSDGSFEIESSIGKSSLCWSSVTELWKFDEYWLVFLSKAQFFTLPLSCLSLQDQELIESSIKASGGRVV